MLRVLALLCALAPLGAGAQQMSAAGESPILTIVPDRLFEETRAGQGVEARIDAASEALVAENRRIEVELEGEERDLTARRDALQPEEFRRLADAFDAKTERMRTEQDVKSRLVTRRREEERQAFFKAAIPILAALMQEEGAKAILDRESVFVSFDLIDVTDRAIARIDRELGDGATLQGRQGTQGP